MRADRVRLKQVLLNLLSNAVKYNRPNGRVTLAGEPLPDGRLRLSVQDTGLGIPLDHQANIFQPFNRLGAENSAIQGTGIGLATVSRIIANASRGRNGSVVLMHCGPGVTPPAVGAIIDHYRASGYRLVTVGELLGMRS